MTDWSRRASWGAIMLGILAIIWGFSGCDPAGPEYSAGDGGTVNVYTNTGGGSQSVNSNNPVTTPPAE